MVYRVLQLGAAVLLGVATLGILSATGIVGPGRSGSSMASSAAPSLQPYPAPPLVLTGTDGSSFDLKSAQGEVALVFFGYASCPDLCPLTLATWSRALADLRSRGRTFQGVFVSVDPVRDTPDVLRAYMEAFDPSLRAVTGSEADIAQAAEDWGVYFRVSPLREDQATPDVAPTEAGHEHLGGEYTVEHAVYTFVVDGQGRVVEILTAELDVASLLEAIEPLLD